MPYCDVVYRVMFGVDPVADVGNVGERLKTVQKTGWHVKGGETLIVERENRVPAERGRSGTSVDQDVVDGTAGTPDEFGFPAPASAVHPAQNSQDRPGLRILPECGRVNTVRFGHTGVEGPREQATLVPVRSRNELQHTTELAGQDLHSAIVEADAPGRSTRIGSQASSGFWG